MTPTILKICATCLFVGLFVFGGTFSVTAQNTQLAFGSLSQDTSLPVEVSAESLTVDQKTGAALFSGNVEISQGDMRLAATRVTVTYKSENSGIARLVADGGVTLVTGTDAAEAAQADYTIDTGVIKLSGDVLLTQGPSAMTADRMTINLRDGTAQMQGRVKTTLQSGQSE